MGQDMPPRRGMLIVVLLLCAAAAAGAAGLPAPPEPVIVGMRSEPDLALPGPAQVIMAVIVTLALAAAALVLLKRWAPKLPFSAYTGGPIKVLARANVAKGLQAHLVQIEGARLLIVEGRTGVAVFPLPTSENHAPADSNDKSKPP